MAKMSTHNPGPMKLLAIFVGMAGLAGMAMALAGLFGGDPVRTASTDGPPIIPAELNAGTVAAGPGASFTAASQALPALHAPATVNSRFQLQGVVVQTAAEAAAVALIAIDGGAARAFHVGDAVGGGLVLQSVNAGAAVLGSADGLPMISLQPGLRPGGSGPAGNPDPGSASTASTPAANLPEAETPPARLQPGTQRSGRLSRLQSPNLGP
jgi:hypothetical protein